MSTVKNPIVKDVVSKIVATINPDKIILFGSYARGDASPDSDIDVLVIKSGVENMRQAAQQIYRALHGIRAPVDVIVETPEHLEKHQNVPGLIYKRALTEGVVVYGD